MANEMAWVHEILDALPQDDSLEVFPWHLGVFDAHCHPTDTQSCLADISRMRARVLTIMATRGEDQNVVANFAQQSGIKNNSIPQLLQTDVPHKQCELIPSFGWHPWFSHQIYDDSILGCHSTIQPSEKVKHYRSVITPAPEDDSFLQSLPDPRALSVLLTELRNHLQQCPYALVGEIGLDRTFRLPENWLPNIHIESTNDATPGGREGRRLSPHKVHMDHQRKILKAQLNLAGEMQRPVSVHGVAAHGILFETLAETWKGHEKPVISKREQRQRASAAKMQAEDADEPGNESRRGKADFEPKPFPPRICLHSYSGPPDTLRQYFHSSVPAEAYCSFSVLVNMKAATAKKTVEVIKAVPDERILVESDLHCAGEEMDRLLERMVRIVCGAKEWSLEEGVKQLGSNWFRFVFGREPGDEQQECQERSRPNEEDPDNARRPHLKHLPRFP